MVELLSFPYRVYVDTQKATYELFFLDSVKAAIVHGELLNAVEFTWSKKLRSLIFPTAFLAIPRYLTLQDDLGATYTIMTNMILQIGFVEWEKFHSLRHAQNIRLRDMCSEVEKKVVGAADIGFKK